MENSVLRQRMYVFVERHLDGINKGIQAAHAVAELISGILTFDNVPNICREQFHQWQNMDKTMILLNGGVSRGGSKYLATGIIEGDLANIGDMEQIAYNLKQHNMKFSTFCEPDLNDALTAIALLVDERVWDREKYPDFIQDRADAYYISVDWENAKTELIERPLFENEKYKTWVESIGGFDNVWLREFLSSKRLA